MAPTHAFDAQLLINQGRVPQETFDQLKKWCSTQKLPPLSDEQLVLFLLSCFNELKATQKTIHAHFTCKSGAPELFFNRDTNAEDVQRAMKVCQVSILPRRTDKNDAIALWRLQDTSYYKFNLEYTIKLIFMVAELPLYQDPPDGLVVLIDLKGLSLLHVTKLRLGPLRKFFQYVQEGYSCKIKQIHVLNTVYFIDKILIIMKPLMSKELYNMITFHSAKGNMSDFFEKHIPIDLIPLDYGGHLPHQATLSMQTYNSFRGMKKFYKDEEEQVKAYKLMQ
ncbi:hypothetical protein MTP99_004800 [Tenebrio molitor]|uniref:CRAL-TRIO domain-containing protein n=1 Tax=Tenebrio molitor TaxID=7067 RepID=A0A8J6LPQ6_TENMO|nr:hypothetical protein GEV33_001986 [Tenebrio molitor]KAJ3620888.1 hypothetical protein MTP99_004800 [Tenebrio molitor]